MEQSKLKNSQFTFLVAGFVMGSILLIFFIDNIAMQDSWLIIIIGYITSIPFLLSYVYLSKRFPSKNLIHIHDIVYGPVVGRLMSLLYVIFYFLILSLNTRGMVNFIQGNMLPETPLIIFIITVLLCGAYAVHKGVTTIANISMVAFIISLLIVTGTIMLLLDQIDFHNFLPMFEIKGRALLQTTNIISCIPFGESVALLMLMPSLQTKKSPVRSMVLGSGMAALLILVVVVRNTSVLGASIKVYSQASFQSVRMINIGEFLTRIEMFIAFGITVIIFIKIVVLYYAAVTSISTLLKMRSYHTLIIPIGSIVVILATIAYDSSAMRAEYGTRYAVFLLIPFAMLLPPISLLVAKLRRLSTKPDNSLPNPK